MLKIRLTIATVMILCSLEAAPEEAGSECAYNRRYAYISDTKRLATAPCALSSATQIEVYEYDADASTYGDTPIFTTEGCVAFYPSFDGAKFACSCVT